MRGIVIENLSKNYEDKKVLRNLSAAFAEGSRTCIMGPSGCGKTTLLRILLGLETADSGEIAGVPERVSVVFQENRLSESLSVRSNLKMISDANVHDILSALGLAQDIDTKVSELSGGMQRRVAIARAILYDGDLLILDEPFAGLDGEIRRRTAEYLLERFRGKTILAVTHAPEEVELLQAELLTLPGRDSL